MQQDSLFREDDDSEPVLVVRKRLVCPRCGRLTKHYDVASGARGVKKLCGACRRISEDGLVDAVDEVGAPPVRKSRSSLVVFRPVGPVVVWECRATFARAVDAARTCPLLIGVVVVLAPAQIPGPRIVDGILVER